MAHPSNGGPHPDPAIRRILEELRDLRVEMRADRQVDRKQAEADRKQAEADRKQAEADRRRADDDRKQADAERRRSDERFEQLLREFREDSARREATTQQVFKDLRAVGLSIVKTLNRHTRILEHHTTLLERIDRKLGAPRQNGRGA